MLFRDLHGFLGLHQYSRSRAPSMLGSTDELPERLNSNGLKIMGLGVKLAINYIYDYTKLQELKIAEEPHPNCLGILLWCEDNALIFDQSFVVR